MAATDLIGPPSPTTQGILDGLNLQRNQLYNDAIAGPPGPAKDHALAQAAAANQAYTDAVKAAGSNGGDIPGASQGTTGVASAIAASRNFPQSINSAISQASASQQNGLPVTTLPPIPANTPSATTTNAVNAVSAAANTVINAIQNSTGSIPVNPGSASTIVNVADQRIRLTPKDMSILGSADNSGISAIEAAMFRTPVVGSANVAGSANSLLAPLITTQGLMFPFTPTIDYVGTANYGTQSTVHANQDFRYYTNTAATTITISGPFSAQTKEEAVYMLACLHFLRVVTKMRFGQSKSPGLPPPVLVLNGYGKGIFYNYPVIVTNFTLSMPPNVDYVQTTSAGIDAWLPTFTSITVTCVVQNTPNKLRTFDWDQFASGALLSQGGWS